MNTLLNSALTLTYNQLSTFADLDNFWNLFDFDTAFGTQYNRSGAEILRLQWLSGDFSQLPQIEILDSSILGNANGAYASSNNQIYLSANFLATATVKTLFGTLLEEIGHFIDAHINLSDSAGDEGAIFAALVQGESLDTTTLQALKAEDDHATITVNGQVVAVEQNSGNIAFSAATYSINENGTLVTAVTVTRTGGSIGAVGATINLTNGTAIAPSDYNNTPITISFADGEISKTVSIPIMNDNLIEGNETVNLTLTNPTNGATIGTQNQAKLTIVDNDLPNIGKWTTVTNGEFETGDLNGWSHISTNTSWGNLWTITSDRSISGNFSAKAVTNTGFNGNGYALQRTVTGLIAGEKYVLSGFIYTGELTSGSTYLDLDDIANDLDIVAGYGIDQWQFVWKEFVAPSNQVTVRLVRDGEEVKAGESAYIDDVAITPISQFIPLLPTITLAVSPSSVTEDGTTNLVYTFTRTGSTTNA
ncbi:hypothetical protein FJR41_020710, partial [Dolichospermum planctonicum UHCC 0167]|uniref:Calx-beta domain-containing protein n=1 Tax=Dolichospermum planctonicum TaxID=136072 RepID=UPI002AF6BB44